MLFWTYDTMITNAYIIFKDMPWSPDTITHEEFCLQCAWGFILAVAEQVSTSHASRSTKPKSVHLNVKKDTSLPLARSCDCGRFPVHFEGGKRLGVGFAAGRRGRTQQKTELFPKTHWACSKCEKPPCLNDEGNCFTEFHKL